MCLAGGGHISHQVQFFLHTYNTAVRITRLVRPTAKTLDLHRHRLCHNNLTVNGYVGRRAGRQFSGQSVHHLARIRRELIARFEIVNQQFSSVHCMIFSV